MENKEKRTPTMWVMNPEKENMLFVDALCKVLNTQKVQDFITNHEDFKGGAIPTFPNP